MIQNKQMELYIPLSIVVATYNRPLELVRCLHSIIAQNYPTYEILVVDDHSVIKYEQDIIKQFPHVRYFYQHENCGPGVARNRGIHEAKYNYVVIIDDDDVFVENAFNEINLFLRQKEDKDYPVYNFLTTNTQNDVQYYSDYSFKDILNGALQGDVTPVIYKPLFWNQKNYAYPDSRIGAESLLWYEIAIDYGFPVVGKVLVRVLDDSTQRLTDVKGQIEKAALFADYQRELIRSFEQEIIEVGSIHYLLMRYRGAITYSLLEGNRVAAFKYWKNSLKYSKKQILFFPLFLLPRGFIMKVFLKYRGYTHREGKL